MSNSTPTPSRGTDAAGSESHLTVEDAGSTTDAADLFHNDTTARDTGVSGSPSRDEDQAASADAVAAAGGSGSSTASGAPTGGTASAAGSTTGDRGTAVAASTATATHRDDTGSGDRSGAGRSTLVDDESISHVFDQTNGVIEGVDGESDGTAEGDEVSRGERAGRPAPIGQQDAFEADHPGADGGRTTTP